MVVGGEALSGGGIERLGAPAIQIAQSHEDRERLVVDGLAAESEQGLHEVVWRFPARSGVSQADIELGEHASREQVPPHRQAARNVRLSVRIEALARNPGRPGPGLVPLPRMAW